MRVRPKRNVLTRRLDRGAHPAARAAEPVVEAENPALKHPHKHRARQSGGPIDNAQYRCSCGMVFDAAVSTSVACPNCGTGQAW